MTLWYDFLERYITDWNASLEKLMANWNTFLQEFYTYWNNAFNEMMGVKKVQPAPEMPPLETDQIEAIDFIFFQIFYH